MLSAWGMNYRRIGAALLCLALGACRFTDYEEVLQEPNAEQWSIFSGATTAPDGSVILVRNRRGDDVDHIQSNIATYRDGRLVSSHNIDHWHERIDRAADGTYWIKTGWVNDVDNDWEFHDAVMERWSIPINGTPQLLARLDLSSEWHTAISIVDFAAGRDENVLYVLGQTTTDKQGAIVKYTLARVSAPGVDTYRVVARQTQKLRSDNLNPLVVSSWPSSFESSHIALDRTSGQIYVTVADRASGPGASLLTYNENLSRNDTDALQRPNIFDLYASHGVVGFLSAPSNDDPTKLEVVQDTGTSFHFYDSTPEAVGTRTVAVGEFDTAKQNCAFAWVPGIHSKSGPHHMLFGKHTFCGDKTQ